MKFYKLLKREQKFKMIVLEGEYVKGHIHFHEKPYDLGFKQTFGKAELLRRGWRESEQEAYLHAKDWLTEKAAWLYEEAHKASSDVAQVEAMHTDFSVKEHKCAKERLPRKKQTGKKP